MKKVICFIWLVLAGIGQNLAQSGFRVDLIADSLLDGSDAVLRFYKTSFDRNTVESYDFHVHYALTILNARSRNTARLLIHYDRNSEVSEVSGVLYNARGEVIGKLNKKDLNDYPYSTDYTLFSDNRVKTVSPSVHSYPYTVEYNYTVHYDATAGFGNWMPVTGFNVAAEYAELRVQTPSYLGIRYKSLNHPFEFQVDSSGERIIYKWVAKNVKSIHTAPDLPMYLDFMPVVMLAPNEISYEGTTGSYRTWNEYGKWVYDLISERDYLPEETEDKMRRLVDTIPDIREKVKAVYRYMQSRTRYVNIALGLGGFQPLHAYEVDQKGYGDCKALSNYTRALLKCVGITSFYTEIGNGISRELKYPDFASVNQTNHVILCVPLQQDTLWLECTNQNIPFGYIGAGNSNRFALLVSEEGGMLGRTPTYFSSDNLRLSKNMVEIAENGAAHISTCLEFIQAEYEDVAYLLDLSYKEQRERLLKNLLPDGFVIEDLDVEQISSESPHIRISMTSNVLKFASKAGKRLFLKPGSLFSRTDLKSVSPDRNQDIFKPVGYRHMDTVSIQIPKSYKLESKPEDIRLDSDFGTYSLKFVLKDNEIWIIRDLEVFQGRYNNSQFKAYNAFSEAILKLDQSRIILSEP
jgi:hypothetical protein